MGKFAIGARVRDDDGDRGRIVGKDGKYREIEYDSGIFAWVKKKWLTPVNTGGEAGEDSARAEVCKSDYSAPGDGGNSEWVPKVGDRVREIGYPKATGVVKTVRKNEIEIKWDVGAWGWWPPDDFELITTPPIGSTVTFTATGRLSAINENGHYQVTFPALLRRRTASRCPLNTSPRRTSRSNVPPTTHKAAALRLATNLSQREEP